MTDQEIGDYSSYQPPDFWDYYYSHTMAAQDNFLCHTIDGKPYTEAVGHRQEPVCNVTDNILVVSNVPTEEERYRVHYNSEIMKRRIRMMGM